MLASTPYRADGYHPAISDPEAYPDSRRMPTEAEFASMETEYRGSRRSRRVRRVRRKDRGVVRSIEGWSAGHLAKLRAPTLILVGDTDFVTVEHAGEMLELTPNGQLAVLPNTTHMDMTRRADEVLAVVEPFLDAPD